MLRDGGGHIAIVVGRDQHGNIMGLGGNQSDAVVCLISQYAHAERYTCTWHQYERGKCLPILKDVGPMPPSIRRLLAERAGRVVNPTCDDVRAVVAWIGEARAVGMAREAGATEKKIKDARRCLRN